MARPFGPRLQLRAPLFDLIVETAHASTDIIDAELR